MGIEGWMFGDKEAALGFIDALRESDRAFRREGRLKKQYILMPNNQSRIDFERQHPKTNYFFEEVKDYWDTERAGVINAYQNGQNFDRYYENLRLRKNRGEINDSTFAACDILLTAIQLENHKPTV